MSMRVLIIEDEAHAAEHLERLLSRISFNLDVVARLKSVAESITWLTQYPSPDLIFMDIQLGDGISFSIFESTDVDAAVIFTTAYDQYALNAFKVNSIDYLLKPIAFDDLEKAILKWKKHYRQQNVLKLGKSEIQAIVSEMKPVFKKRFLVKAGHHLKSIAMEEISFFISRDKITFLFHTDGRKYPVDYPLTELEGILDPHLFFRVNRQYIINHQSIADVMTFSNSRLKIRLKQKEQTPIVVSRDRVTDFRNWLDK